MYIISHSKDWQKSYCIPVDCATINRWSGEYSRRASKIKHNVTNWVCHVLGRIDLLLISDCRFGPGKLFMVKKKTGNHPLAAKTSVYMY